MKPTTYRSSGGSVAMLAFIALIPLIAAIGGFSVDLMHFNDEKGALLRATDAAAIAGAQDLWMYKGTGGLATEAQTTGAGNEDPVNQALTVAGLNDCDGVGVATGVRTNAMVDAAIYYATGSAPSFTLAAPSPANLPNLCQVKASLPIRSLFAMIFGNISQTVTAQSAASPSKTPIDKMLTYFPMMVSLTDQADDGPSGPMSYPSLQTCIAAGAPYSTPFVWNSRANSAWTNGKPSGNDPVYGKDVVNYVQKNSMNGNGGDEGPIQAGQSYMAKHGTMNNLLANASPVLNNAAGSQPNLVNQVLILPVTTDTGLGTGSPNHQCVGFVAVKVTAAGFDTSVSPHTLWIQGTLTPAVGANGANVATNSLNATLTPVGPTVAKLVQ